MIDRRLLRVVIAVTSIVMVVGCTELNPNSCAQNASLCKPGTYCAHRKDKNGAVVTECLPVEDGAAEPEDAVGIDGPDAAVMKDSAQSTDASADLPVATIDARETVPDAPVPDAPPACANSPCTLGNQQCGPGGGLRSCVMSGGCPAWGPESSCGRYVCSGNACKTTCSSGGDCAAGATCRAPDCVQPSCGDSHVDPGEECDKGSQNSASAYGPGLCTDSCKKAPYCGDGITNGAEKCDAAGSSSTTLGSCNPECTGFYEKKYIYRTNQLYPTNMGGIAGADANCVAEFGAKFKALIVGTSRRATVTPLKGDGQQDWVVRKYTHYYSSTEQLVWRTDAVSLLGVRDGQRMNLYASVYDTGPGIYAWSGYASDWTTLSDKTCSSWTVGMTDGDPYSAAFCLDDLTYGNLEPCGKSQYLLCVEQ